MNKLKRIFIASLLAVVFMAAAGFTGQAEPQETDKKDFIKWADFNASYEVLDLAYKTDIKRRGGANEMKFTEILAYLTTKNGNVFHVKRDLKNLKDLENFVDGGGKISDKYPGNKYYRYNYEVYEAVFGQAIGEYTTPDGDIKYGMKNFFPIAKNYWYNHYDDFGNPRTFGYKRKHLGHDLMGSIGTPIVAIEGGTVTELGWNMYGGWRVGIRSADGKRYYYYAHLRRNEPFRAGLKKGDAVKAGEHIGYLGRTGFSSKENTDLKTGKPHLHIGLQLIFDESQVTGNHEIWIDIYNLTRFYAHKRAEVIVK